MSKQINCPNCGALTVFSSANLSRPFCSERCRLIDLGAWATEKYTLPVTSHPEEDETNVQLPAIN